MQRLIWRKSSYSATQGECIEVADLSTGIGLRDSKQPEAGHLTVTTEAFSRFLRQIKHD